MIKQSAPHAESLVRHKLMGLHSTAADSVSVKWEFYSKHKKIDKLKKTQPYSNFNIAAVALSTLKRTYLILETCSHFKSTTSG